MSKRIICFSGGRGNAAVFRAIKEKGHHVSALVNALDNGLSTGLLRAHYNILGISDIRKSISGLASLNGLSLELEARIQVTRSGQAAQIEHVFETELRGQSEVFDGVLENSLDIIRDNPPPPGEYALGNLALLAIFCSAHVNKKLDNLLDSLGIPDRVNIVSEDNLYLCATTATGHLILDEGDIVVGRSSLVIDEIYTLLRADIMNLQRSLTEPDLRVSRDLLARKLSGFHRQPSIAEGVDLIFDNAHAAVFCPGTPFSSLFPTYMTEGLKDLLVQKSLPSLFVTNMGADYESPAYVAEDYVRLSQTYLQRGARDSAKYSFSTILVNKASVLETHRVLPVIGSLSNESSVVIDDFSDDKNPDQHSSRQIWHHLSRLL